MCTLKKIFQWPVNILSMKQRIRPTCLKSLWVTRCLRRLLGKLQVVKNISSNFQENHLKFTNLIFYNVSWLSTWDQGSNKNSGITFLELNSHDLGSYCTNRLESNQIELPKTCAPKFCLCSSWVNTFVGSASN